MFFFAKRRRSEILEPLAASRSERQITAARTSLFRWPSEMRTKDLLRWIIDFGRQR